MSAFRDTWELGLPDIFNYPSPVPPEEMTLELLKAVVQISKRCLLVKNMAIFRRLIMQSTTKRRKVTASAAAALYFLACLLPCGQQNGKHSFPLYCIIPAANRPCPAFLHINFRDAVPDRYMPSEEISDQGFACFSFCYHDVTRDNADFTMGWQVSSTRMVSGGFRIPAKFPFGPGPLCVLWTIL